MANSKGAKTKSNVASKISNVPSNPAKSSEANTTDDVRNGSPEIEKDDGVENPNKDENDSNVADNTKKEVTESEVDADEKTDTDLYREEDINIAETETEVR